MSIRLRRVCCTGSGWCCLWDTEGLRDVTSDTWEDELLSAEDVSRHIRAGSLVPVNGFSDGGYDIEVRVGSTNSLAALSEMESRCARRVSPAFRFRSQGRLALSAVEFAVVPPGEHVGLMEISAGDYTVFVHEIDRNKPEAADCASFVLLLNPCDDVLEFAGDWYTFVDDRPRTSGYIGIHIEHAPDLRGAAKCIQEVTDGIYSIIRDKIKSCEPILIGNLHDPCASQLVVMMQKIIDGLAQQGVSFSYAIDAMLLTRDEFNDVLSKHGHARI